MAETRRIALAAPIWHDPPRFAVGGQTGQSGGDVKVYEWIKDVGRTLWYRRAIKGAEADSTAPGDADDRLPDGCRIGQGEQKSIMVGRRYS